MQFFIDGFWMGNSWLSVLGLVLDIIGFGVLACDLWPEFAMNSTWWKLDALHDPVFIASAKPSSTNPEENSPWQREVQDKANARIEQFISKGHLKKIDKIANAQSEGWRFFVFKETKVLRFDGTNDVEWLEATKKLAEAARSQLAARRRPPVFLAVFLIFIGFVLQAWGSVPVSQFRPALTPTGAVVEQSVLPEHASSPPPFRTSGT